jgi:hypothetical protein
VAGLGIDWGTLEDEGVEEVGEGLMERAATSEDADFPFVFLFSVPSQAWLTSITSPRIAIPPLPSSLPLFFHFPPSSLRNSYLPVAFLALPLARRRSSLGLLGRGCTRGRFSVRCRRRRRHWRLESLRRVE